MSNRSSPGSRRQRQRLVNDLSGTDVVNVAADLGGGADGDNVVVNATTATTSRPLSARDQLRRWPVFRLVSVSGAGAGDR